MNIQGLVITSNTIGIAKNKEWVNAMLERLFSIELNEMVGALTLGTRLYDYVHTVVGDKELAAIINEVSNLIINTMPMIILKGLGVEIIQDKTNTALVFTIEYAFADMPEENIITKINKIVTV